MYGTLCSLNRWTNDLPYCWKVANVIGKLPTNTIPREKHRALAKRESYIWEETICQQLQLLRQCQYNTQPSMNAVLPPTVNYESMSSYRTHVTEIYIYIYSSTCIFYQQVTHYSFTHSVMLHQAVVITYAFSYRFLPQRNPNECCCVCSCMEKDRVIKMY